MQATWCKAECSLTAETRFSALVLGVFALAASGLVDVGAYLKYAAIGLGPTLDDVLLPTMRQIGSAWEAGHCDITTEHLTTEAVRSWRLSITRKVSCRFSSGYP